MQELGHLIVGGKIVKVMVRSSPKIFGEYIRLRESGNLGDFLLEHNEFFEENEEALMRLLNNETIFV